MFVKEEQERSQEKLKRNILKETLLGAQIRKVPNLLTERKMIFSRKKIMLMNKDRKLESSSFIVQYVYLFISVLFNKIGRYLLKWFLSKYSKIMLHYVILSLSLSFSLSLSLSLLFFSPSYTD